MRKRIKTKVSINKVVNEINHKRNVYSQSIKDVMRVTGKNYLEAKKQLNQDLKTKAMQRELRNI